VPIPPAPEAKEIVLRINQAFGWIDRIATEYEGAARLIDRLDQSILAKAFRGELIPQDPNDERASILLERIRADRATQPNGKAAEPFREASRPDQVGEKLAPELAPDASG
jgi:type I restriction enzyme S subunit